MDAYLIEGIQESNEAIFSSVYQQYHAKLYYYFFDKSRSPEISKELVQTTFIKLWNHRYRLDRDLALSAQLFRIAKTTFIDLLREKARERIVSIDAEDIGIAISDSTSNIHPLMEEVTASLEKIPPQRGRIIKFRLEGLNNQEIADRLGISKKTVENQLNKAVKDIRHHVHTAADISFPIFLICLLHSEEIKHSLNALY